MRRVVSLAIVVGLLVVAALMSVGTSLATAPSPGVAAPFTYRATVVPNHFDSNDYKIFQKNPEDIVMRELTIPAGGNSGWHSHPGVTYVILTQGTLTNYHANDPTCTGTVINAGESYIEPPGDVHNVRNEGTTTAVLFVTFLDVPVGGAFRTDAPRPAQCPF